MPCKNRRAFMSSHARFLKYHIGTGGPRHLKHSELLRLLNVSGASGDGRNDVDRDSELEEIFNGTWPYLSRRAKLGYTKGVSQAGMRNWNAAGGADKPVTARNKKAVIFVPSKLDSCGSVGQPSAGLAAIRGSGPRVPTPPWLAADDEVEEDASTITGSSSSPCRSKGCESNHPGLGYFAPELCEISPMNETNLGHRLLQRLGWEPGQGLGANNHGLLDPVGCVPHSSSPSFLYPVAST
ncbi:unnamed protein product [Dicrocoelium dendriticum]|nr:unnamed protein product [Dicrocoelium dendriticum]